MLKQKSAEVVIALQTLDDAIQRGVEYLRSITDPEGGVPNHVPGDRSGAWTTAEVLVTVWEVSPWLYYEWLLELADYVLKAQFEDGSWPVVDERPGTTVSTAAGILAALATLKLGRQHSDVRERAIVALDKALYWLHNSQNRDKGWGIINLPGEAITSLTYSTSFSLYALSTASRRLQGKSSKDYIRAGLSYLEKCQNPDGGWGAQLGSPSTVAHTAKVLSTVQQLEESVDSDCVAGAVSYILHVLSDSMAVCVFEESTGNEYAPVIVHHNTPFNLLDMLINNKVQDPIAPALVDWFVNAQLADGSWRLACFSTGVVRKPSAWVTAEAIAVLDKVRSLSVIAPSYFRYLFHL